MTLSVDLKGMTAIVSGSTRGIGRGIAEGLIRAGCRVAINGRNPDEVAKCCATLGPGALAVPADVSSSDGARELVTTAAETFGEINLLVCNVGSGRSLPPGEETADEWRRMIDLNLLSAVNLIENARPSLCTPGASIVCISSICGHAALGAPIAYGAAKAALNAMVSNLARPLGKEGVRLNAVSPGNILFEGSVWEEKSKHDATGVQRMLDTEVPLGRLGSVNDIVDPVLFLLSPSASFITGTTLVVDGGQLRNA